MGLHIPKSLIAGKTKMTVTLNGAGQVRLRSDSSPTTIYLTFNSTSTTTKSIPSSLADNIIVDLGASLSAATPRKATITFSS